MIVEWPRGAEAAQWRAGPEAQFFLLAAPEDRVEAMRRLVARFPADAQRTRGGRAADAQRMRSGRRADASKGTTARQRTHIGTHSVTRSGLTVGLTVGLAAGFDGHVAGAQRLRRKQAQSKHSGCRGSGAEAETHTARIQRAEMEYHAKALSQAGLRLCCRCTTAAALKPSSDSVPHTLRSAPCHWLLRGL